jgi:glyoxylase-like metal-dependent hydrolase (beta-lactamase superfamily II)
MLITKNVHQLSGMRSTGIWGANIFLLLDKSITLVDTGLKGKAASILGEVKHLGYSPSDIANIIITHHHADHAGSLAELKKATGARILAHPSDVPYIDGRLPQPGPARPRWLGKALAPFSRFWGTVPISVDTLINDEDVLPVLGGVRILHTPGHTPGSISLYLPQSKLVIVGDLLANRFGLSLPSMLFTVDIAQEINSIKKLASLDFDIVCFGHGRPLLHEAQQKVAHFAERLKSRP